jgi:hypothetical protein
MPESLKRNETVDTATPPGRPRGTGRTPVPLKRGLFRLVFSVYKYAIIISYTDRL